MADKLSPEQIRELEAALANFVTKLKGGESGPTAATMMRSVGGLGRGHGSHFNEG